MPGGGEKALERVMCDNERRRVHQWMRVHGVCFPQPAVHHKLDGMRPIVNECKQAHRSRHYPEMTLQPLGRRKSQPACSYRIAECVEVDAEIVRNRHEEMPSALLVAQKQILGLRTWQCRH